MPHPKNHLKLTGDTHLPDVGFEPITPDETVEMVMFVADTEAQPRVYADGWAPPAQESRTEPEAGAGKVQAAVRRMEPLPARSPWLAIGAGLAFGWLVAKMLRR